MSVLHAGCACAQPPTYAHACVKNSLPQPRPHPSLCAPPAPPNLQLRRVGGHRPRPVSLPPRTPTMVPLSPRGTDLGYLGSSAPAGSTHAGRPGSHQRCQRGEPAGGGGHAGSAVRGGGAPRWGPWPLLRPAGAARARQGENLGMHHGWLLKMQLVGRCVYVWHGAEGRAPGAPATV